jgi:exosortase/archaeosortase family protein
MDSPQAKPFPLQGKAYLIIGLPALIALLPLWIIRGANSDWRLINFALFLVTTAIIVSWAYDQGGWKRIRTVLFPLFFFLLSIPWPLATDLQFTQWLQGKVSGIIVDIILILGHEAKLEGTVIDVGKFGQIGIDQACSGIQGFQASVVITLFLGAYYGFGIINRLIFVLVGALVALLFNLVRAFSLSMVKINGAGHILDTPIYQFGSWVLPSLHDMVGWIENLLILLTLFFLARLAKGGIILTSMGTNPSYWSNIRFSTPWPFQVLTIAWVTLIFLGSEFYYSAHEEKLESLPKISLNINDPEILVEEQVISNQITAQLHFSDANSIQWQKRDRMIPKQIGSREMVFNPNQEYWQAFEANWESGGACTAVLSTHSPAACLPLTGLQQVSPPIGQPPKVISIAKDSHNIAFEAYEFTKDGKNLHVFRCFWPSKALPDSQIRFPSGGYSLDGRIKATIEGRRNVGGTMLALAIANVDSPQTAINKLQALVNQRLSFGNKEAQ